MRRTLYAECILLDYQKIILSLYIPCHYEHHPGFCLLLPYIARHIYGYLTADSEPVCISMQNLTKLIQTSVSCVNIVLFKGKVWANFKVFRCPRSFKYRFHLNGKGWLSRAGFLHQVNRSIESNFRAFKKFGRWALSRRWPSILIKPNQKWPRSFFIIIHMVWADI